MSPRFRLGLSLLLAALALGCIVAGIEASPPEQGPVIHVVKAGDTLSTIADKYGVSVGAIMQANRIQDPSYVFAGQRLKIPGASAPAVATSAPPPPPTAAPRVVPPTSAPTSAPVAPGVTSAPAGSDVYTVKADDTLGDIASRYNTTIDAIAAANGISPYRDIFIGQKLRIPGASVEGVQPAAAAAPDAAQPASASAGSAVSASVATDKYVVQSGDTLSLIAMRFNVSYHELATINSVASSGFIYPGQTLTIPGGIKPAPQPAAAEAPAATPVPTAAPARLRADRPRITAGSYTIQSGDTLSGIATQFGVPMALLARANNISNARFITPGRTLTIPKVAEPGNPPWGEKKIEVDISMQTMFVWEGDVLVNLFVISTGLGDTQTRRGVFHVKSKVDKAYSTVYDLYMPTWLGIYDVGTYENGIHSLPIKGKTGKQLWAGVLGSPVSFGCVVTGVEDGKWLYDWAEMGTTVEIKD